MDESERERKFGDVCIFVRVRSWRVAIPAHSALLWTMKILPVLLLAASLISAPFSFAADPAKPTVIGDTTPAEVAIILKNKPDRVLVLDVRTPDEFAEGHIPGAMNVDFLGDDFDRQIAALPADKTLIVHCAAGNRSAKAVAKIREARKYGMILHLKSGFNGWKAAGKPVETKPAAK